MAEIDIISKDGFHLLAEYLEGSKEKGRQYLVTVSKDGVSHTDSVPATYEPRFGIDVGDADAVYKKAEEIISQNWERVTD